MDWQIQSQALSYFLAEAPELLQTIEEETIVLPVDRTTARVHNLMRALHTLKGAAANVELNLIKHIAHKLEDVVKIFYNAEVEIDAEIQDLLLNGCSLLRRCLDGITNDCEVDEEAASGEFATILDRLQELLAQWWEVEVELPSSVELGFDFVAAIFESNIKELIDGLKSAIATDNRDEISTCLSNSLEICTGLAESVELPGFLAICHAAAAAIERQPTRIVDIAKLTLKHWQQSSDEVLAGDRERGGTVDAELAALAGTIVAENIEIPTPELPPTTDIEPSISSIFFPPTANDIGAFIEYLTGGNFRTHQSIDPATQSLFKKTIELCWDWFAQSFNITSDRLHLELLITDDGIADIDYTNHWIDMLLYDLRTRKDSLSLQLYQRSLILQVTFAVAKFLATTNTIQIAPAFLADLRALLQQAVNSYKYQPPVTPAEAAWLDRLSLPHIWHHTGAVAPAERAPDLLESFWGEDTSSAPLDLPTVDLRQDSLAQLAILTGKHQERCLELQTRPNIEDIHTELAEISATAKEIDRLLSVSLHANHN